MSNVTVSVTEPTVNVNTTNNTVNVATTTANVVVSDISVVSNSDIRRGISISNVSGFGNLAYDSTASSNGVIQYTGVSTTDIRGSISNASPILYNSTTGVISANVDAIFSNTLANNWFTSQTTNNLTEGGSNLYFTQTRARQSISATGNISYNNSSGVISEDLKTQDITEGDNLYFTSARARGNVSVGTPASASGGGALAYNDTTGVFTFTPADINQLSNTQVQTFIEGDGLTMTSGITSNSNITTTANTSAGNATVTGVFTNTGIAEQPSGVLPYTSINSAGDLVRNSNISVSNKALTVTGNITAANIAIGNADVSGTVNAGSLSTFFLENHSDDGADRVATLHSNADISFAGNVFTNKNVFASQNLSAVTGTFTGATSLTATGNVSVGGNLNVTGNINSETVVDLFVEDRNITLQFGTVGSPSANSQIFVDRGSSANTYILWDEGDDKFKFSNDGSTDYAIPVSTSDLAEGTNLYFTNTRADARFDVKLAAADTDSLSEGSSNLYFTAARSRGNISVTDSGGDGSLAYNSGTGVITYTGPSAADTRGHISVTDSGGDGSLAYDSGTGVITYTGPSAAEVRAHLSATANIFYNSSTGVISEDLKTQDITEGDNLYFTSARARGNISVTDAGGLGSAAYDSGTGVITYTGPADSDIRGLVSVTDAGGLGSLAYNSGTGVITYTGPADLAAGKINLGSTSGTTIPVTPDGNFTTTANAFSLSTTLTDVNSIASATSSNISLDTNTKAVKILKDFASVTSQDTLTLDSDGYRPTTYNSFPSYSGTGLRRNTLHEGTATAGSPVVTVTKSAVAFWYGTPSAAQRTNAFANIATNCMFVTQASAAATGNNTTTPFPVGTRILSVDASAFTITMTQNATADATFSQASSTGLFTGDGSHDPSTTFGELYVSNADFSGGSDQTIEFGQFTGSTDNLSYGEAGPLTADLTRSVASGTITVGTYAVQQKSKLIANKGYTESKNGFTVGEGGTLTTRFENDNFATKGINIFHDGQSTFSTEFTNPSFNSQYGIKQYTDNCLQNSFATQGPRVLLSSAKGKNTDDPFGTYPRSGQSLGQIAWQATTGTALTPSSLRPPVYINAIAAEDHSFRFKYQCILWSNEQQ